MNDSRLRYHDFGFLQVVDPPSPEALKSYYGDSYYQTEQGNYRKTYSEDERSYLNLKIEQKASLVSFLRGTDTPGSLLDVGCGEGFTLAWFRDQGWCVRGIDYSIAGIEAMNSELQSSVEVGDLFSLLDKKIASSERYDLVWLNNVLEHVIDPVGLLIALRRLVATNGILVVTVPNDGSAYQENLLENGNIPERFWIAIPDHMAYFTRDSLKRTAESTGWFCSKIISDFPIDFFLLHSGSNYVCNKAKGKEAHHARIQMELLLSQHPHEDVNRFYEALARVGLGRDLTAFLSAAE